MNSLFVAFALQALVAQTQQSATTVVNVGSLSSRVTISASTTTVGAALDEIAKQSGVKFGYPSGLVPVSRSVSIPGIKSLPVRDAVKLVLRGTGVTIGKEAEGHVALVREQGMRLGQGMITGKVIDSKTGRAIAGATVSVIGDSRGIATGNDGSYRLTGIPVGNQTVIVRVVGYAKQTRTVSITEGATVNVDFKLDLSASVLDQVIVTGTVVQTELRAVPNAITVITAKQIEERGITRIDQLFRGEIPGLFALQTRSDNPLDAVLMYSRGTTALSDASSGTSWGTNPIKTYVDGVEMANSQYLSQIDPRSIERIEILTGPQASTIYGSNALNGVMQIFTKRGSSPRPQLALNAMSGWVENDFSKALTPQHNYNAQLSGIEGRLSYNIGGAWDYIGAWTPAKRTARSTAFGGMRLTLPTSMGSIVTDITSRRSNTQNNQNGHTFQRYVDFIANGWYKATSEFTGAPIPAVNTGLGRSVGLSLMYNPVSSWSHEINAGDDVSDTERRVTGRGYASISDTTLNLSQARFSKKSVRYTTTGQIPVSSQSRLTMIVGAEAWNSLTTSTTVSPQSLTGTLSGTTTVNRRPGHNTGAFLQTEVGVVDNLFLTYGLRAEWNPTYGASVQPNYSSKYGIAIAYDFSAFTAKLRGSYGRSTRPPASTSKDDIPVSAASAVYWGPILGQFGNPDLGPETQQGGEGGIELYLGSRASLVVTRYNQTVDNLISSIIVDSANVLPWAQAQFGSNVWYGQNKNFNIGSIRNQGWELQGSTTIGPITTRATYSWNKSRTIGITPSFRSYFKPQQYPRYQPGASFLLVPEHTWSTAMSYNRGGTTLMITFTGAGRSTTSQDDFFAQHLEWSRIRLDRNIYRRVIGAEYTSVNMPFAMADIAASHRLNNSVETVLQIQNVENQYITDSYSPYATMGRQVKTGLRIKL